MTTLSLALIVRNEAELLGPCLESARPWVDEIVAVDTGSTDGTQELLRAAGARVFDFPWVDDFSAARNAALDHCTGDWVLILDADEELDAASGPLLRRLAEGGAAPAFRLTLRNYLDTGLQTALGNAPQANDGRHARAAGFSHFVDFQGLRFFRREPWVRFQGRIHELVDEAFLERGLPILPSEGLIHHFGKTLLDREAVKRTTYLELARRDAEAMPGSPQAQFNLLQQAFAAQDWTTVEAAARAYASLRPAGPSLVLFGGAVALQSLGRDLEALAWFDRLLEAEPGHAVALTRKAVSLAALGRAGEARRAFATAQDLAPDYALPYLNQAEMEGTLGEAAAAREVLERGLRRMPREAALWEALVGLGIRQQRLEVAAADAWRAIQAVPTGGAGLWHLLVAASLARMDKPEAARAVLQLGLRAFPGDPELGPMAERLGLR